ncbi:MAG: hydrogenase formation protein HypD [Bryobacteraceae bacterium]|nr:hydrogenase formation protein HypD [Bryobacteraceae bacterium]
MKYLSEFRDPALAQTLVREIRAAATTAWPIMEVCGGQTHSIVRHGIDELLHGAVELIHGPGCPVCVTPVAIIDRALALAALPHVTFCSFGDMLRVPGSRADLFQARSEGADVRVVYSPLDAVQLARENPTREIVFFAIGFETTAPANAMAALEARRAGLRNFSMLVSHVLVPPAVAAVLSSPQCRVRGLLAAGHVCSVMGYHQYPPLAERFHTPIVVTGFEPLDILEGIRRLVLQLERGEARVENAYERVVTFEGNRPAQQAIADVFEVAPRTWRGIAEIAASGWRLNPAYRDLDAEHRFDVTAITSSESPLCHSGQVLQGLLKPNDCPAFGKECTPRHPLGATMVSSEGACAAYFNYGRIVTPA